MKVFVERSTSEAYFKGAATIDFFMYSFRRFSLKLLLTYLLTSLRIASPGPRHSFDFLNLSRIGGVFRACVSELMSVPAR